MLWAILWIVCVIGAITFTVIEAWKWAAICAFIAWVLAQIFRLMGDN